MSSIDNKKKHIKNLITIIKFLMLLLIVVGIPIFVYYYHYEIIENFGSVEKIEMFLSRNEEHMIIAYLVLQVAQLVICIIPGQAVQLAGGYIFNIWLGFFLTIFGCAIGTFMAFYISRILGRDAMYLIFGESNLNNYIDKLNSRRAYLILFIIYLIPGIPKDLFAYAIGVSNMRFLPFFLISMIGRAPAMLCSLVIGAMLKSGSYTYAILLTLLIAALAVIGIIKRNKISNYADIIYERLSIK